MPFDRFKAFKHKQQGPMCCLKKKTQKNEPANFRRCCFVVETRLKGFPKTLCGRIIGVRAAEYTSDQFSTELIVIQVHANFFLVLSSCLQHM